MLLNFSGAASACMVLSTCFQLPSKVTSARVPLMLDDLFNKFCILIEMDWTQFYKPTDAPFLFCSNLLFQILTWRANFSTWHWMFSYFNPINVWFGSEPLPCRMNSPEKMLWRIDMPWDVKRDAMIAPPCTALVRSS